MDAGARQVAERAARTSYGKLLSILIARTRDIAAAEDALSSAFEAALRVWPDRGVPANPEAWLVTTARNAASNVNRHHGVAGAAALEIRRRIAAAQDQPDIPDARLSLMFLCAHPAIDESIRAPLMLQTVLGMDAGRIARAFVVSPDAMAQRLVRAKAKIRDAGLRYVLSEAELSSERLLDVLDAVYAAYGTGWEATDASEGTALVDEAIYLGRLVVALMPAEPEAKGLLALMLYCEARRPARRSPDGEFVPLELQEARLWSRGMIVEAEGLLTEGSRRGRFGRYLCEAAIQSVHVHRPITGKTNHDALLVLYGLLQAHVPSVGAMVALAAVQLECGAADKALARLDVIPAHKVAQYQPYWVTRARLLRLTGDFDRARGAMARAIDLTEDDGLRRYLVRLQES